MSIAEKLTAIAEDEPKVYAAGKAAEQSAFWDDYQQQGARTNYSYAFYGTGWTDITFHPKYDIQPTGAECLFYNSSITDLVKSLDDCGVKLDLSKMNGLAYRLFMNTDTKTLPELDLSNVTSLSSTFRNTAAVTIPKLIITERCADFITPFSASSNLVTLIVEGTIAANGFAVSDCKKLSHESLMSIINALKDFSEDTATHTCTLGTTNLAKLTDEEKAIATEKGWTLA